MLRVRLPAQMRFGPCAFAAVILGAAGAALAADQMISASVFQDRLEGGWAGEMIGVTWGAPTEFVWQGAIIPDGNVPVWAPATINGGFNQDDIYVEAPFIQAMKDHGVNCSWTDFGNHFRDTTFSLWHANYSGRWNLQHGIAAPWSGHYSHNTCCDDIDWQIESDFAGLVSPGQTSAAINLAWRAGHVMNYGDGVYGGVAVAVMHSAAYFATNVRQIVDAGRQAVPSGSQYRQVLDDVVSWHDDGKTWEETWQLLQDKWGTTDRCSSGVGNPFNIDAKLNGAYVVIGLLYGNGDFEQSMRIAMRCGQDSDCNPSTVGGILGNWLGLSGIPDTFKSDLDRTGTKFSNTDLTFDDAVALSRDLARNVLLMNGGSVSGSGANEVWTIPTKTALAPILEQWPSTSNAAPALTASAAVQTGLTIQFDASATDTDGIADYQWFFGDLTSAGGASGTHTYGLPGTYEALCYVTDGIGNTSWQSFMLDVTPEPAALTLVGLGLIGLLARRRRCRG